MKYTVLTIPGRARTEVECDPETLRTTVEGMLSVTKAQRPKVSCHWRPIEGTGGWTLLARIGARAIGTYVIRPHNTPEGATS